jgi:ribosomal protein S25
MAHAAIRIHATLHGRLHQAEKALKAARARNQQARTALLASTGAGAAARRMVVELSEREVRRAAAELTAAAEAVAAVDPRQIPLSVAARAAPRRAEAARTVQAARVQQTTPPPSSDAAEPLFAWARAHAAAAC